jgi:hypothetical protein
VRPVNGGNVPEIAPDPDSPKALPDLSHRAFRAWLRARSPYGSVGLAGRMQLCPIAAWLGHRWLVTGRGLVEGPDLDLPVAGCPEWIPMFVGRIDRRYPAGTNARVSRRAALEVLAEVEAWEAAAADGAFVDVGSA